MSRSQKWLKTVRWLAVIALLGSALPGGEARAQQQQKGLCAEIKMVINQRLTLERTGFLATLSITDNDPTDPITDFGANLTFENSLLSTNGTVNDSSGKFFVQPPTLQGISDVAGTGIISPGQTATISWFIIPATNAGGMTPNGIVYQVAASLSGKIRGNAIPAATLQVFPASITVQPDALLRITYFTPRDVTGDNPFTPQVESPIPFTFGVLVQNVGYGLAHNMIIASQQPKITENKLNLLIIAQLLGSRINDSPLSAANLTVNLGDLQPGQATKGAWDMITSLSGTFLEVSANYTHSSALGGAETSLIQSVSAYLFLHEVLNDQAGRDNVKDFLADTSGAVDAIGNLIPDSIYESQGNILPVNQLTNVAVVGGGASCQVNVAANFQGWGFIRVPDPAQAKLPIGSVVRSDGKVLNPNNYWSNVHFEPINNLEHDYLNLLDLVDIGNYSYSVTYTNIPGDITPPVTTLSFAGSVSHTNGAYYVTPETQIYFLAADASPVSIFYSLNGGPTLPAYPFSLTTPGSYQITYFAIDTASNQETNHTATIVVPGSHTLGFAQSAIPGAPLFVSGGAASVRPTVTPISFTALPDPTPVNARIEVFQGAVGWAVLSQVPSSPTAATTASLTVGGVNVDFYQYRLNGGAWSAEATVGTPLTLSGLAPGTNVLAVLGRSQFGAYPNPTNAVTVGWFVDPAAPPTIITGTPATPSRLDSAQFAIGGSGVTSYSWTTNLSFFRAPAPVASPLILSNLPNGSLVLDILGTVGGVTQATNHPTTVAWTVNPLYGFDQGNLPLVRSAAFTNVGTQSVMFGWDGRNGAGVIQPPGVYTVRITLTDALGYTNFVVGLAQISSLAGTNVLLADVSRGPLNPHARGRWAVWQDQSSGHNEIYARDVTAANGAIIKVSNSTFSQQNPRTDGRYVVWQGRQANASWDVYIADLAGTNGPVAVTATPTQDEIAPAVDWPWVVYQSRPAGNPTAPWQLYARNVLDDRHFFLSSSVADQVTPDVQARRVVWQDFRDVGPGEIYLADLETATVRRISTNLFGQYHPVIQGNWIVWQDNRNTQNDLYGFDLLRNREVRLTSTPEDETQPFIDGDWVVCLENSLGANSPNARLVHLPSLLAVPATRTSAMKTAPVLANGLALWQEGSGGANSITGIVLPALQGVFQNRNLVAVTPAMVSYAQNAFGLLTSWASNGVTEITVYTALSPTVASQTAKLVNGTPTGANFSLTAGGFLWVQFGGRQVLDLGADPGAPVNLVAGDNVVSYTRFPNGYDAYQLLRQLGLGNAPVVRMLDAGNGRWRVAEAPGGVLAGDNFPIPNVAVLLINLANPVNQFLPQTQ